MLPTYTSDRDGYTTQGLNAYRAIDRPTTDTSPRLSAALPEFKKDRSAPWGGSKSRTSGRLKESPDPWSL